MAAISNYSLVGVGQNLKFSKGGANLSTNGVSGFSLLLANNSTAAPLASGAITAAGSINANSDVATLSINGDTVLSRQQSGIFQFNGTGAVVVPVGSAAVRPGSTTAGMFRYNSDTNTLEYWNSATWTTLATGGTAVTAVSVNTANGFAGTSSGGTTPALTLTTSVTGILYGNGTSMSAATISEFNSAVGQLNQDTTGTATHALNLTGGAAGELPYQTGSGTTGFSAAGTTGQYLVSGGTGAPTWSTLASTVVTSFQTSLSGLTPSSSATGAITLAGTLGIASGGTGQVTQTAAFDALSGG